MKGCSKTISDGAEPKGFEPRQFFYSLIFLELFWVSFLELSSKVSSQNCCPLYILLLSCGC